MAVFTSVTLNQLKVWLEQYNLGQVLAFSEIAAGIENSNFFFTTRKTGQVHEYVLTLFERLSFAQLPFYLDLMGHLARHEILVPEPLVNVHGETLTMLNGKPAAVVNKLAGRSVLEPQVQHCQQVGAMLARMHLAGKNYPVQQENLRSLAWWQEVSPLLQPHLNVTQNSLLMHELAFQQDFFASDDYAQLPAGIGHRDLFRDNVLFECVNGQDKLSGFIDFYFAACDKWLFDLAVTVNDWCIDQMSGVFDEARLQALLISYQEIRPLTRIEENSWPAMLRAAALRFWISRLWDFYFPRDAKVLQAHDPNHFERVLQRRRELRIPSRVH